MAATREGLLADARHAIRDSDARQTVATYGGGNIFQRQKNETAAIGDCFFFLLLLTTQTSRFLILTVHLVGDYHLFE